MLLIVGLVAAVLRTFLVASHEPVYEGKKLSAWLEDMQPVIFYAYTVYPNAGGVAGERAENAIREIGTNGIPRLLREIHTKELPWKKLLVRLAAKQSHFKVAFRTAAARRGRAAAAFQALGPAADAAIPALVALLDDRESAAEIGFVLTQRGPKVVLPVTQALANGNAAVRFNEVGFMERHLGWFSDSELTVPALVNCLKDSSSAVRERTAHCLGLMSKNPTLVVPALTHTLADNNASVRATAAWALCEFGKQAESAIPALSKSLGDKDKGVRDCARYALERIRPEAVSSVQE
jgi:HEAT repeat protein